MRLIDADYVKEYCKTHRGNVNFPETIPSINDIPTVDAIPIEQLTNKIDALDIDEDTKAMLKKELLF